MLLAVFVGISLFINLNIHVSISSRAHVSSYFIRGYQHNLSNDVNESDYQGGFSACLLIMDDTIKLREWLAYHYVVLPLRSIIIAIDSKSKNVTKIMDVLKEYKDLDINITVWNDDDYLPKERPNIKKFQRMDPWIFQQHVFCLECQKTMKHDNKTWTLFTDSDEFLVYNYFHEDAEDENPYGSYKKASINDLSVERNETISIRKDLPLLTEKTVIQYLFEHKIELPSCIRLPALYFGANESSIQEISKGVPPEINPYDFMTLRYRKHNMPRSGGFTKVIMDVSQIEEDWLNIAEVHTVHNPNLKLCGWNGDAASGTDYTSSIFRINHYLGSMEAFLERINDFRKYISAEKYSEKNLGAHPHMDDDDIRPWVQELVRQVGMKKVQSLLLG